MSNTQPSGTHYNAPDFPGDTAPARPREVASYENGRYLTRGTVYEAYRALQSRRPGYVGGLADRPRPALSFRLDGDADPNLDRFALMFLNEPMTALEFETWYRANLAAS